MNFGAHSSVYNKCLGTVYPVYMHRTQITYLDINHLHKLTAMPWAENSPGDMTLQKSLIWLKEFWKFHLSFKFFLFSPEIGFHSWDVLRDFQY